VATATRKNLNLAEIGRRFQVSAATVSNVLNNKGRVSPALAERIIAYADEVGYRPSLLAQSLKGCSRIVGLCLRGSLAEPWYVNVMAGVQRELREHGFYVCTVSGESGNDRVREALDFFVQLKTAAVVVGPLGDFSEYLELKDAFARVPHVVAFDTIDPLPLASVGINIYQAAFDAVHYLYRCGHRRIGYICQTDLNAVNPLRRDRFNGWVAAMKQLGLPLRSEWLVHGYDEVADYGPELLRVRALEEVPTAFFCLSDINALRVLKAMHCIKWRVPEEISLISVDNLPAAELSIPGLTSMDFNCDSYVRSIADCVLEGIAGRKAAASKRLLDPTLVVRESVRCIAPA